MSRINFMLNWAEHEKSFITSKPVIIWRSTADSVRFCKFISQLNITAAPCADPEGWGMGLLENPKSVGFVRNTGMDPLENHKASQTTSLARFAYWVLVSLEILLRTPDILCKTTKNPTKPQQKPKGTTTRKKKTLLKHCTWTPTSQIFWIRAWAHSAFISNSSKFCFLCN